MTPEAPPAKPRAETKKSQILGLYAAGITDVAELASLTRSRPSYAASVLQGAGLMSGYFDLYTNTSHPMNIYSKYFQGRTGFRDVETATRSAELIDRLYQEFDRVRDRAGQHHALVVALTLWDRARWSGHAREGEPLRRWLEKQLARSATGAATRPEERLESRRESRPEPDAAERLPH
jgi:hypothetical protein